MPEHRLAHISSTLSIDGSIDQQKMCNLLIADDVVPRHDYDIMAVLAEEAHLLVHISTLLGIMHLLLIKLERINGNGPLFLLYL
jgi:hypothetical protein